MADVALIHRALDLVAQGASNVKACAEVGISLASFQRAVRDAPDLRQAYARAREHKADLLVDEIIDIVDTDPDSNRARNRADARKWVASKFNSSTYGDRLDLNVGVSVSVLGALKEAEARVASIAACEADVLDAEIVPQPTLEQGASAVDAAPSILD